MIIFKDYTTDELVMNLPCEVNEQIKVYPISVKDYKRFIEYTKYLVYGKQHLGVPKEMTLLQAIVSAHVSTLCGGKIDTNDRKCIEAFDKVLKDIETLLSMLTKINFVYEITKEGDFIFSNDDKTIVIDDNKFKTIRMITLKMNMLREPKIYEREIDKKWEEKALIARNKNNKNIELGEILTIVRNVTHEKYEELIEMNMFQLYCDYFRIQQVINHEDTTLFATVNEKVKISDFVSSIVEVLYRDPTKDLNVKNDFTQYMT